MRALHWTPLAAAAAVATLFGVTTPVAAQTFHGGLRADLAFSDFRAADYEQNRRTGFRVGLWGELELSGPSPGSPSSCARAAESNPATCSSHTT